MQSLNDLYLSHIFLYITLPCCFITYIYRIILSSYCFSIFISIFDHCFIFAAGMAVHNYILLIYLLHYTYYYQSLFAYLILLCTYIATCFIHYVLCPSSVQSVSPFYGWTIVTLIITLMIRQSKMFPNPITTTLTDSGLHNRCHLLFMFPAICSNDQIQDVCSKSSVYLRKQIFDSDFL